MCAERYRGRLAGVCATTYNRGAGKRKWPVRRACATSFQAESYRISVSESGVKCREEIVTFAIACMRAGRRQMAW